MSPAPNSLVTAHLAKMRDFFEAAPPPSRAALGYRDLLAHYYNLLIPDHATVLEIGCGGGELLARLRARRVVGIDLSPAQIANYFAPEGDGYRVKPMLRDMVKFAPMNLAQPVYLGRFDCIFCMNVLIYFGSELRSLLIQRFYEYLEPGGYLFLGHAESAANAPVKFIQTFMNGARLLQKPLDHLAREARAEGGEA